MTELRYISACLTLVLCFHRTVPSHQQRCPYAAVQVTADPLHAAASAIAEPALRPSVPAPGFSGYAINAWLESFFTSNAVNKVPHSIPQTSTNSENYSFDSFYAPQKSEQFRCAIPPLSCTTENYYYRSLDGSCNNLVHPGYGMAKSRYSRLLRPSYSDGIYSPTVSVTGSPLPNARLLSLALYGEDTLSDGLRTLATMQWGQLVAHDLSEFTKKGAPKDCCANPDHKLCYPIALHPYGPISYNSGKKCLHFVRSTCDVDSICPKSDQPYAEKITLVTAYLDLSSIYGNSVEQNCKVRQYKGGLLKASWINNRPFLPVSTNSQGECGGEENYQCYNIPDSRNQFIPTIAVLHTILLREHNRIASVLAQLNPHHSDERLFQDARRINIAQVQKITYYDWLPIVIGPSYASVHNLIYDSLYGDYVNDYDPKVNPAPLAEYAAAALRYYHNQIPGWFSMVSPGRVYNETMRLSDYFGRPENVNLLSQGDNFDSLIRGLVTQLQKRPDGNIDRELKHYFDRKASEEYGEDLKAIDIQRARDYGIPSYNDLRHFCGLPRAYDWTGFAHEISSANLALMRKLYASPDDVDLAVGGSLESHAPDSILGPTFQCIVGRQFLKTRTGDRFFFEGENPFGGFTKEQLAEIRKVSLSALLCNNADYLQFIQGNSFILPNARNVLRSCNSIPQLDLRRWKDVPQPTIF